LTDADAIKDIRIYPDKVLRASCQSVAIHDQKTMHDVQRLVVWLKETMRAFHGYGLSAPQIGVPVRVFVVHVPDEMLNPLVFVNPVIVSRQFDPVELSEGCLSFPSVREPVSRPECVQIQYSDDFNRHDTHIFGKWTARAIYHEMDHMDGKLLVDHMLPAAKRMVDRAMAKYVADRDEKIASAAHRNEVRAANRQRKRLRLAERSVELVK